MYVVSYYLIIRFKEDELNEEMVKDNKRLCTKASY